MPRNSKPGADRRARFVAEYLKDFNAQQAAIRAGYAKGSAHVTASRLLRDPVIAAQIGAAHAKANALAEITVERTRQEIARIAFGDIRQLFDDAHNLRPITELSEAEAALIAGIDSFEEYDGRGEERVATGMVRRVKLRDKLVALEKCMSILGMHKSASPGEAGGLNLTIRLSSERGRRG